MHKYKAVDELKWKFITRENHRPFNWTIYRNDKAGLQMQIRERMFRVGIFRPRIKVFYFIDGVKGSFRTEAKMMKKYLKLLQVRNVLSVSVN